MSVVLKRAIAAELRQRFLQIDGGFLSEITAYDEYVDNDTINFNKIGALPDVVEDTAGPFTPVDRVDDSDVVSLTRLDSIPTKITDAQLHALAYDKKSSVRDDHQKALELRRIKRALYNFAPSSDAVDTPVLKTTGASFNGRKRLTLDDLMLFRERVVKTIQSDQDLILVLCNEHAHDIRSFDQSFRDRYNNTATGQLISMLEGFKIYVNLQGPVYNNTTYAKKAFGAVAAGTDTNASVFFTKQNAMRCTGSASVYYSDASIDPINRQSLFGAAIYNMVRPIDQTKAFGTIISDAA